MKKVSFNDLLSNEIESKDGKINIGKIRIPMIQRDYAQGRKTEEIVRKHFLESIFDTLIGGEKILELDFVYGSTEKNNKHYHFIPLDGQQRLTTLFLLYWYIGTRELVDTSELKILLSKFTYETRYTSSKFCEKLASCKITFEKNPSDELIDNHWFHLVFKKDPSIRAMLNMLDSIHIKYNELDCSNLFEKLSLLQFYILPLNDFNLNDELYIKMNARGKQLTEYENFKADLTKWMKSPLNFEVFHKTGSFNGMTMPFFLEIAIKLDNNWTDLFWTYSNKKPIDSMMMRFIHRFLVNQHIINKEISNKEIQNDPLFKAFYGENGVDKSIGYSKINNYKELFERNDNFKKLVKVLDFMNLNYHEIRNIIKPVWGIQWELFSESINQRQRILFLATTLYIEKNNDFEKIKFAEWIRVVWNIAENTNIDSVKSMAGLMDLIYELSNYSNEIHDFLGNLSNVIKSDSSSVAVSEERLKATFIIKDIQWLKIFIDAEKHPFFRGSIDFILTNEMSMDEFIHRSQMANQVFDENGVISKYKKNGHIFLRALISRFKNNLINLTITDSVDKDNHLRSMLFSNPTIKETTRFLFSLSSIEKIESKLNEFVLENSQMKGWSEDNEYEQVRIRRAHEAFYKKTDLQIWMQQNNATRFSWSNSHLYISKPKSWYTWVMLDTCINELIVKLLNKHEFITDHQCYIDKNGEKIKISYFWIQHSIILNSNIEGFDCQFIFDNQSNLFIWLHDNKSGNLKKSFEVIDKSQYWICIKKYNYNDEKIYNVIKKDIFNEENPNSVIQILKSIKF